MGRITYNDANALSGIDYETRCEILYLYLVRGWVMKDIASELFDAYGDFASQTISVVTRGYGFHDGRGRGRYRSVDRQVIDEFVDEYQPEDWDGGLDEGTFDGFLREKQAQQAEAERRRRQAQQQAQEAERRRQAQQAEAERRRRQAQQLAEESERRFLARQAEAERRKKADYDAYVSQAKQALKNGQLQTSFDALHKARSCEDTWELNELLAETMARSGNADKHAAQIIRELTELRKYLQKKSGDLNADQHQWLARAYLASGDKSRACDHFFYAGDIFYDKAVQAENENQSDRAKALYRQADVLYTEGREKTGYYSSSSVNAPFRVAYARYESLDRLTEKDYRFCESWYQTAIENGDSVSYAYVNRSYFLRMLGEYSEAVEDAKRALELGLHEKYVYSNLLKAQVLNCNYDDAMDTMAEMDRRGYSYDPWMKGECLLRNCEHAQAVPYYEAQLKKDPNHLSSLKGLLWCCCLIDQDEQAALYGLRYLKAAAAQGKTPDNLDAIRTLDCARICGRQDLIRQALEFNPEEKAEVERQEREHQERERQEREHQERELQERERQERERQEREHQERERQERERQERERQERERQERERQERERQERERQERERQEREHQERERQEREKKRREEDFFLLMLM